MSGRKKKNTTKTSPKLPVGADGLNKHQRYYQKKKRLAQIKSSRTESIASISDETGATMQGNDGESSSDSLTHPPRLFYRELKETEANLKEDEDIVSPGQQSSHLGQSQRHTVTGPSADSFFSTPELLASHDPFSSDWHQSAPTPDSTNGLLSAPESLESHDLSFDWRPPKQIAISTDDPNFPNDPLLNNFGDYDHFMYTRDLVARWSKYWTGMENWPEALDTAFERHKGYGPDGASLFLRKIWYHEQRGRQLLHRIQSQRSAGSLPSNPEALMALWNLQQDQVMVLTRGLTIMELTGSLALRYIHSIAGGRIIGAIPSALSAPDTPLFGPSRDRETKQDEEDVERYLKDRK